LACRAQGRPDSSVSSSPSVSALPADFSASGCASSPNSSHTFLGDGGSGRNSDDWFLTRNDSCSAGNSPRTSAAVGPSLFFTAAGGAGSGSGSSSGSGSGSGARRPSAPSTAPQWSRVLRGSGLGLTGGFGAAGGGGGAGGGDCASGSSTGLAGGGAGVSGGVLAPMTLANDAQCDFLSGSLIVLDSKLLAAGALANCESTPSLRYFRFIAPVIYYFG
jgi:hypothetical protein